MASDVPLSTPCSWGRAGFIRLCTAVWICANTITRCFYGRKFTNGPTSGRQEVEGSGGRAKSPGTENRHTEGQSPDPIQFSGRCH